jgi:predicted nucleic acid-binding protein
MSGRFFLDTNIFVYEFDLSEPRKSERASDLIRKGIQSKRGVVSYQVVQEFLNVVFKKFARPMPASDAEQYLSSVFRPMLSVHSSPRLFLKAIELKEAHRLAWYDSLIVAAALETDCEILYSENLQAGKKVEGLRIENPFAVQ